MFVKDGPRDDLVVRSARVIDPGEGIDGPLDVRVDAGVITEIGLNVSPNGHRVVEGRGLVLAPAFVDPHVHLRTPGREDEETIATGTAAAAAGGYCAILAMPNTDPVVDSAAVLGSLIEAAREEVTEMAELADAGAVGFSDDGRPVVAPGVMRRALQYHGITGRRIAVHCEEPTLSGAGQMHEGAVSAELGFAGYPSIAESAMVARDLALASYEREPLHLLHLSARESVEEVRRWRAAGVAATAEATPHHLVRTDEAIRSLDANLKMNPPLRSADDRASLVEAVRDGTIEVIATDHAPHAAHEKDVPFEEAPFGVTGLETAFAALNTHLVEPGLISLPILLERMSSGPARAYGLEPPRIAKGERANLVLLDPRTAWRVGDGGFRSRSRTEPSSAATRSGRRASPSARRCSRPR